MAEENSELSKPEPKWEVVAPTALESIERAQVDLQISTARRFPRTMSTVFREMKELALLDEDVAASCFYRLGRQGKNIEGPTIRLAEIAVSCFGHIRFGARVIENDGKSVTAQGFCFDLQKNVMASMEVKRRITDRNGQTYSEDMQIVTGNAACAIAARNAIFKVIPMALIKPIMEEAKKAAIGTVKTLAERRTRTIERLGAYGVSVERVCQAVDKKGVEDIGLKELETLFGLYNAIKEEQQTVEEAFPEVKKTPTFGAGLPPTVESTPQAVNAKSQLVHLSDCSEHLAVLKEKGGVFRFECPTCGGVSSNFTVTAPSAERKPRGRPRKPADGPTGPTGVTPPPETAGPTGATAPPRATPLEGLWNLMRTNNPPVEAKDLLTYLFSINKVEQGETLEKMPDDRIKMIIDQWPLIAPNLTAG